jgi:peptidoglycan/xylan/chitin deacetylase (PgdA/CDA1 family)
MIVAAGAAAVSAWLPATAALAVPGHPSMPAARAPAPTPKVVVTFAWGGGLADQMSSLPMLRRYGMHATYFVASGLVCTLSQAQCQTSSPYLTLADVREIAADGNEIGGLSVTHQQLTTMPAAEAKREICDDRSNLFRLGFQPTDFAYPFALVNPAIEALTRACGYSSGLGTGTLKGAGRCNKCPWAETIPPENPYNVRTPVEVNSVGTTWVPRTYESIVTDAQRHGGGWIIFTLHDICQTNCSLGTTPAILDAVLSWLHKQRSHHVVVETMGQVIGGPVRPPVAGPAPRPLPPPGVANANLAQANGALPACFQKVDSGGTVASFTYQPGRGPHGSVAETVRVTRVGGAAAELAQTMDLGLCAPSVSSGRAYTAGAWYQSSHATRIEIYRRTWLGSWTYWATSPYFPASASWRQASWTTPVVPSGTTAISFGLTADGVGAISTSYYSLKLAKSYKLMILLGVLLFVVVAAGLIARGQYRYNKFMKAEAAEAQGETEAAKAHAAAASPQAQPASAGQVSAQAQSAKAPAEPAKAPAEPVDAPSEPAKASAEPAKALTQPVRARPQPAKGLTQPVRAQQPMQAKAEDVTVIISAVNPADTRKATGDSEDWLPTHRKTAGLTRLLRLKYPPSRSRNERW